MCYLVVTGMSVSLTFSVNKVVYRPNDGGSYFILQGYNREHNRFTVCGNFYGCQHVTGDMEFAVQGSWVQHPKYGRQFAVQRWRPSASNAFHVGSFLRYGLDLMDEQLVKRVQSEGLKGVPCEEVFPTLLDATASVKRSALMDRIRKAVETLDGGDQRFEDFATKLGALRLSFDLFELLDTVKVSPQQIQDVYDAFGSDAADVVRENPYLLLSLESFNLNDVEVVAKNLNIPAVDPRRVDGVVLWALREARREGSTCRYIKDLVGDVGQFSAEHLRDSLKRLSAAHRIVVGGHYVYLKDEYTSESKAARLTAERIRWAPVGTDLGGQPDEGLIDPSSEAAPVSDTDPSTVREFIREYEQHHNLILSDAQREALYAVVQAKIFVISGKPGTGKTSLVKAITQFYVNQHKSVSLMAPTGIAAKRLAHVTGHEAATVHRALGCRGAEWTYNEHNRLTHDVVVVDEMSMVDSGLYCRIVSALSPTTTLVLVGDDAQLPSVGSGNVLKELLSVPQLPKVCLTHIFRQAEESDIIMNAHNVLRGMLPESRKGSDSDFQFVELRDEEKIADFLVRASKRLKDRNANFQVLTAKHDGVVGVNSLNARLQAELNPQPEDAHESKEVKVGSTVFRVGDRVMVVKNDYELAVYNGDVGKLLDVYEVAGGTVLQVKVFGPDLDNLIEVPMKKAASMLKLAYAVTVHKCQGLEFDTILVPVVPSQGRMRQRNLLYTAITRAKKKMWLLGDKNSVKYSVENTHVVDRTTQLAALTGGALGVFVPSV